MKLHMEIYNLLVNGNPAVRRRYLKIRRTNLGTSGRIYAWMALIGLNIRGLMAPGSFRDETMNPDRHKFIPRKQSESSYGYGESPEVLIKRLAAFDIISFDIFDTLLFRPFSQPTDVFHLVGQRLKVPDFARIRVEMEARARAEKHQKDRHGEVTLQEIYSYMERYAGISAKAGIQAEIETECQISFANPYMYKVVSGLNNRNKTIIAVSDMYLPAKVIRQMLKKAGFTGISQCHISCEEEMGKGNGELFAQIKQVYGLHKKYAHVGDNRLSDVAQAKRQGFHAIHYPNINEAGTPYRSEDMSVITGSMYRGIINTHIHNGLRIYSREYELGFIYGGLFVVGYCRFIHQYVKQHDMDKILFLSRDGDILHQVYELLYPHECAEGKVEYVYWSRLAAAKMAARFYKYDYFRRFLYHKVNQGYELRQIFQSMELEDMLSGCLQFTGGKWQPGDELTERNAEVVKEYLLSQWEQVLYHYEDQLTAGRRYYKAVLKGCKKVVAVDVGWAGSGALALQRIIKDSWGMECKIIGLLAGTNTVYNAEPDMSEPFLHTGELVSYLFSQSHNRDLWKWHNAAKGHNLGVELLLSSKQGSLKKFETEGRKRYRIVLKEPDVDGRVVAEIHKGIKEFALQMAPMCRIWKDDWEISGRDAYAPIKLLLERHGDIESWVKENMTVNL